MYGVGSTMQDHLINEPYNETAAAHTGSDEYKVICKHQWNGIGNTSRLSFGDYYYHISTSKDGVYCLKGEGHVVVRGYYVGLTVRLQFKNAPSDLSWRTKYMLPIIALLYFTRLEDDGLSSWQHGWTHG
ncbi:hypothetical protein O0I10_009651 [Lichtheimia ornata]|uniref:Uncharacterized protein n=1 Tax=Lichtheimia ornata TaxID=688661 RepID=A0AAD7UWW5_9FUNG|nr:uncharacterized protein O0I10_009651 [Lichtheimia ornata]KAJ8654760.1 hypothetical protein O0I10_009651 [Lichtheimia ornata]